MASSLSKGKKRGPKPKTPTAEPSPSVDSGSTSDDLSRIVEESKKNLAEAEPQAPKNKGGRPAGSKNKPKEEPQTAAVNPQEPQPASEMTKGVVAMPFFIAAENTGCDKILLTEPETVELAQSVEAVMKTYLPQLSERAGVLAVCVGSFAMVTFSKYMLYKQWCVANRPIATSDDGKTEVHASETPKEPASPTKKVDDRPPILAESFFPRENQ